MAKFYKLLILLGFMVLCLNSTKKINSKEITSTSGNAQSGFGTFMLAKKDSWTWADFAGSAVVGGVAGAAGGAAVGLLGTPVGVPAAAGAGALGGAVGGAIGYVGAQVWSWAVGSSANVANLYNYQNYESMLD
jgi:hypothetical protein